MKSKGLIKRFFTKKPMDLYKVMGLLILTIVASFVYDDIRKPDGLLSATYLAFSLVNLSIAAIAIVRWNYIDWLNK